jgi:hypothetical protein
VKKIIRPALVIIVLASSGVGAAVGVKALRTRGREPSTRFETRDVGPAGQPGPVQVGVGNPGTENEPPLVTGPFRIVSRDWVDPHPTPTPAMPTPSSTVVYQDNVPLGPANEAAAKASPYWAAIGYTPRGYNLDGASSLSFANGEVSAITWDFVDGAGRGFQVFRVTRDSPIEIVRPNSDGFADLVIGKVNDNPAIFIREKAGQFGPQTLYMVDGRGIFTEIDGWVLDFNEFIKMAESLSP